MEDRAAHMKRRRERRRGRPSALLVIALVAVIALPLLYWAARSREAALVPRGPYLIGAWTFGHVPSLERALEAGALDEVSCDWLQSRADGSVVAPRHDAVFAKRVRDAGVRVFVTLTDYDQATHRFDPAISEAILPSRASREAHVRTVLDWVVAHGFDGVDVDWEAVKAKRRQAFTAFVAQLAAAAHRRGLLVGVDVYPKVSEPGAWSGPRSQDWSALGRAVDQFRIMTYNYSGAWSGPEPLSPSLWIDRVLTFAETRVEPHRIIMGVGLYGRLWNDAGTTDLVWSDAQRIMAEEAPRRSRGASRELTLHYRRGGADHVAFFPDKEAISAKLQVLLERHPSVGGICCWLMGQEDPGVWPVMAAHLR